MRKPVRVAILGGGPSALFAFYGALEAGFDWQEVQVRASKKTYPPGAFWLHRLPKQRAAPDVINIRLLGTADQYSLNQWGKVFPSSAAKYQLPQDEQAYNPHKWIPELWKVVNFAHDAKPYTDERINNLAMTVDYVIQTFPTDPVVLLAMKQFEFPVYHTTYDAKKFPENYCVYNGNKAADQYHWNRCTQAFGMASVEYAAGATKPDVAFARAAEKQLGFNGNGSFTMVPDIHPEQHPIEERIVGAKGNILLTGRWTTMDRKALSHDSQAQVREFLTERKEE